MSGRMTMVLGVLAVVFCGTPSLGRNPGPGSRSPGRSGQSRRRAGGLPLGHHAAFRVGTGNDHRSGPLACRVASATQSDNPGNRAGFRRGRSHGGRDHGRIAGPVEGLAAGGYRRLGNRPCGLAAPGLHARSDEFRSGNRTRPGDRELRSGGRTGPGRWPVCCAALSGHAWALALSAEASTFALDTAHRRGDEIVYQRDRFWNWSARLAVTWRTALGS